MEELLPSREEYLLDMQYQERLFRISFKTPHIRTILRRLGYSSAKKHILY